MTGALQFALLLLELAPMIAQAANDVRELQIWGQGAVQKMARENRDPTDAEWAELNRRTDELRTKLHSDST